jgi:hypothetical protein
MDKSIPTPSSNGSPAESVNVTSPDGQVNAIALRVSVPKFFRNQ